MSALLVLDAESLSAWAAENGIEAASSGELATDPRLLAEIDQAVTEANTHLARVEQVRRYKVLADEWTSATGELTPTLKKRRRVIVERYAQEIDDLYA